MPARLPPTLYHTTPPPTTQMVGSSSGAVKHWRPRSVNPRDCDSPAELLTWATWAAHSPCTWGHVPERDRQDGEKDRRRRGGGGGGGAGERETEQTQRHRDTAPHSGAALYRRQSTGGNKTHVGGFDTCRGLFTPPRVLPSRSCAPQQLLEFTLWSDSGVTTHKAMKDTCEPPRRNVRACSHDTPPPPLIASLLFWLFM